MTYLFGTQTTCLFEAGTAYLFETRTTYLYTSSKGIHKKPLTEDKFLEAFKSFKSSGFDTCHVNMINQIYYYIKKTLIRIFGDSVKKKKKN